MKKILNIFATISLITSGTSTVIGCSNHHNHSATKQQEEDALIHFAQQHGIQENEINKSNWSFQDGLVVDKKENINFTFEENHNIADNPQHSQLLKQFNGEMTYNLEKTSFHLDGSPFDNPTLTPGYYKPSTNFSSTIIGNANDFTIAAGYDDLDRFGDDLTTPDTQTLPKLFSSMHWKNVDNFKGLTVSDLENLQKNYPQDWTLPHAGPKAYMALIHIIKTNGNYQIAWTNLDSDQDKTSLLEPGGAISSVFWKDVQYHLWCSQQLVQELTQIYALYHLNPNQNPWFQKDNLNKWLIDRSGDPQTQETGVGIQTINTLYPKYNTSNDMADKALQSLNNSNFASWVQDHHYKNYDLVFNKDFSFNAKDSQELN